MATDNLEEMDDQALLDLLQDYSQPEERRAAADAILIERIRRQQADRAPAGQPPPSIDPGEDC